MLDKSVAHMLSTVGSVYAIFVYCIAFALEMWFIFSSDLLDHNLYHLNTPGSFDTSHTSHLDSSALTDNGWASLPSAAFAFILAAVYFITLIVSLLLMLGLIIRSMLCLLVWLVTFGLLFFPECGLVLHLSLNIWHIDTRNGQVELCFYVIRAIMNVFFMICVQNLICQWRTEKQVSNYVSSLNAFQGYPGLATVSGLNTLAADPSYFLDAGHSSLLSISSPPYKCNTLGRFNQLSSGTAVNAFGLPRTASIKHNPLNYTHSFTSSPISEFDARNFNEFMSKNGLFDDYVDGACVPNSNGQQPPVQYSTQSLDRRRFLQQHPANRYAPQWPHLSVSREQVTLRPLNTKPFDYLQRPGSMSNLNQLHKHHSSGSLQSGNTILNHNNNNNDVNKVNLNLHPNPIDLPSKLNSSSTSGLDKLSAATQPSTALHKTEQSSSLHSIRDIAL